MKNLLLIFATMFITACVSNIPKQQAQFEKSRVIQVEGLSKEQVFDKSRQWFSEYFVSGESVVDYENRESGSIIGNGVASTGTDPFGVIDYQIKYQLRVDTKNGRLKVTGKVQKYMSNSSSGHYENSYINQEQLDMAQAALQGVINDLEVYVNKAQETADW